MILKNSIHEAEPILSMILIQSEGTCYEHFLYSLDAAILVHLSTASYPRSHTFGAVWSIWVGTIFIESMNWESMNREHTRATMIL